MNLNLNLKRIKEMCGSVSFKKGDTFYRSNKVILEHVDTDQCEATVKGNEDFHVTIKEGKDGAIEAQCSCPKLASFQNNCQHIAAVLLVIYDQQQRNATEEALTEGLLGLFHSQLNRTSREQTHFETRQRLKTEFLCQPIETTKGNYQIAIKIIINETDVRSIHLFLESIREGEISFQSSTIIYDPSKHCFSKEVHAVIEELILIVSDSSTIQMDREDLVIIPSSSWERIFSKLEQKSFVKFTARNNTYAAIQLSHEPLSLSFYFTEQFKLKITGIKEMIVFPAYHFIFLDGKFIKLTKDDCKRLVELKQMVETAGVNFINIPENQVGFFLDKVVPGLKKFGTVHIAKSISQLYQKNPLVAKLFLDRVNHRLLAALEFHYKTLVIHPLDTQTNIPFVVRDTDKEEIILDLIEQSQFAKTDGGYILHNEELEYEFLNHIVPELQKLVQVYATTAVKIRLFSGKVRPRVRIQLKKERTNWLEFTFKMDGIPDQEIRDLLQALEEKRKYYRLRNGSLLSLETKEFNDIKQFLSVIPNQAEALEKGLSVPIIRGLQYVDTLDEQTIFTFEEAVRNFLKGLHQPVQFDLPKQLDPILRDYQKQGFQWMRNLASYRFGGILADDMGLGKTVQSITYIVSFIDDIRQKKQPVLIVCPSSLNYNWLSEIDKFAPEVKVVVIDGPKKDRLKQLTKLTEVDVAIISYPLLRTDIASVEKLVFHTLFFDEAQAFKNPATQTARAAKKLQATYRFALTGTPIENSIVELWSIFHVVFPELFLGLKQYSFLTKEQIARRSRPFLLRRMKSEVLTELPEKVETTDTIELLPEQKRLYTAYLAKLRHKVLKHLDKETIRKNRIRILAGLTRLRQICCHPCLFVEGYHGGSAKFDQLLKTIEEAKLAGRRVLIFSQFTKMLSLIGAELTNRGLSFFYLDGQTPSEERVEICHRFNRGERDFFLISLKAGGTGLNLTGADTVILYDIWWNPAVEDQAADRAYRIGQTNSVQVIKLITKGTIEEKINELQLKKKDLIEQLIDSTEKTIPTLTEEDIRQLLMS